MTPEEECVILWQRLAETGSFFKGSTIRELYAEGELPFDEYEYGCPLCEAYIKSRCADCPWPDTRRKSYYKRKCTVESSPFQEWWNYTTKEQGENAEEASRLAYKVLELVKTFVGGEPCNIE